MNTHAHMIRATYVGPTNTRGSRVALASLRFPKDRISDGYAHRGIGGTYEQAGAMLAALGYTVIASGEAPTGYIFAVREFRPLREALAALKAAKGGAK